MELFRKYQPLFLFAAALLVRLLFAAPGMCDPGLLMRPDSDSYLQPAQSIADGFAYSASGQPTALRVPFYPLFTAMGLAIGGGDLAFCVFLNCVAASCAVPAVWLACRELKIPEKWALCGTLVYLLTPTPVALAPMFLSDALFASVVAFEGLFLIRYFVRGDRNWLFASALAGGVAVLTRPLNLLWIVPCVLTVLLAASKKTLRARIFDSALAVLVFAAVFTPWIFRNRAIGAGWRIDSVSADSLKHNASVVESRANGIPAVNYRTAYEEHFRERFVRNPELFRTEDDKLSYQEAYLAAIVRRHPGIYLRSFLNPVSFVPDIPSFLENLGITRTGRGTWDVIVTDGLIAGVEYYFAGHAGAFLMVLPLSLILIAGYCLALYAFFAKLRRREYLLPLLALPLAFYYYLVTGAVAYPRFSLPGLPFLCVLAAAGLAMIFPEKEVHHDEASA